MSDEAASARKKRSMILAGVAVAAAATLVGLELKDLWNVASDKPVTFGSAAPPASEGPSRAEAPSPRPASSAYSNIYKYDYVGPEACGACHPKNYELWRSHPHSKMNRNASAATVVGDFGDARLDYGNATAVFSKDAGEYRMRLYHHDKLVRSFKVTRTVGSRFVQMYVGIQTEGPEPPGDSAYREEVKLPFSYWIERKEWFPQTYDENPTVSEYDDKGELTPYYAFYAKGHDAWDRVCIKCHNTYPYALRFDAAPDDKLVGFPAKDISFQPPAPPPKREAGRLSTVDPYELVTLGISCESCHFGGRQHAQLGEPVSFLPKGEGLTLTASHATTSKTGKSAYAVDSICHQCHASDPQGILYPNGAASWNSREAADLLAGSCASEIACTDCHNPHQAGPATSKARDESPFVEACTRCHDKYRKADAAAAHAGHPKDVKVSCLDCHMPRMVHGLSSVTRSHRISSPTDPAMLAGDYPNACNLCHLDKSLAWTLDALKSKWRSEPKLSAGFAASTAPLGSRWLTHEVPVVRQVAAAAYARSPLGRSALGEILPLLDDKNPPTRMFAVLAVEDITGKPLALETYTPWWTPEQRRRAIQGLERSLGEQR